MMTDPRRSVLGLALALPMVILVWERISNPSPTVAPSSSSAPSAARDCGVVDVPLCDSAAAAALTAVFPQPGQLVSAWHVGPTRVKVCDGVIEPEYDVLVQLTNPDAVLIVTVGNLPDGRVAACTY